MNRSLTGALAATALAVTLAVTLPSCDAGLGGYVTSTANCSDYLSCETCTPVVGCGWCTGPRGSGVCASDPDYCPTQEFSWTWDVNGCRVAADASVVTTGDGASTEGSVQDSAMPTDGAHTRDASGN